MISVVIPTLNDGRRLAPTLAALVPGAADGLLVEAIVADGGSTDATEAVADAAGCRFLPGPAERGARLTAGAATARAPWLLFLPPGVVPGEGWIGEVRAFLDIVSRDGRTDGRVAVFGRLAKGYGAGAMLLRWRDRLAFLAGRGADASQGLLIGREHYGRLGGHRPVDETERDLSRRIGRRRIVTLGVRTRRIEA